MRLRSLSSMPIRRSERLRHRARSASSYPQRDLHGLSLGVRQSVEPQAAFQGANDKLTIPVRVQNKNRIAFVDQFFNFVSELRRDSRHISSVHVLQDFKRQFDSARLASPTFGRFRDN